MFQAAVPDGTSMRLAVEPGPMLRQLAPQVPCLVEHIQLHVRTGAELTFTTLCSVRDLVLEHLPRVRGAVLLTGTDTLDEAAFFLLLCLGPALARAARPLVIAGAMKPADVLGYDGSDNAIAAMKVAAHEAVRRCAVLVVLNDDIHLARYVYKRDSTLMGAFASHPGPIGQMRNGQPLLYYQPTLDWLADEDVEGHHPADTPGAAPCALAGPLPGRPLLLLPGEGPAFMGAPAGELEGARVAIYTLGVSAFLPTGLLEHLDGLVLAAPGTGSLSAGMVAQLSPEWTARMPIVICSRCPVGNNHDESYYRGSRKKYEARGFLIRGYEHSTPVQARTLLVLRLAAGTICAEQAWRGPPSAGLVQHAP